MPPIPKIGDIVRFHEEGGPYAALVAAVNPDGSLELATFGKNSLYFQHGVKEVAVTSEQKGRWSWT